MDRVLLAVGTVAFLLAHAAEPKAQQTTAPNFIQTYKGAVAQAQAECTTLWSNHAFDTMRKKFPTDGAKPTFEMLKNGEKLKPKDKKVADLAIKTLEKCRGAWTAVYAMLPPQVSAMIHGVERQQDSIIAELFIGKITIGDFNVAMNQLTGQLYAAISGVQVTPQAAPRYIEPKSAAASVQLPLSPSESQQSDPNAFARSNEIRLALVIGNSSYTNLPRLSNPINDAHAIVDVLKSMGYKIQLVLDASEQNIRREVRQFASDSEKADVALVFYAGHGAQVNGSNYLLPIDIDVPRTEVDIQFSGLKVDDLVNGIRSNTKIVFLDACRDNPVLFKNIVKGRGSSPIGLAPAATSAFEQKPGGGVFIAYATDAGAVADDGHGKHSPFTQALLRNLQKPISIDDMFSLVTKEVRLVTKNTQRPYKYASLENIICVAPKCSTPTTPTASTTITDVVQQAKQSQSDELQIALQTSNVTALETYLQKYPDTSKRAEIENSLEKLKRAEFTEWTLVELGDQRFPWWMKLSSIEKLEDRIAAEVKQTIADDKKVLFGKPLPTAEYFVNVNVFDCKRRSWATSEETVLSKSGETLYHYKFAEPRYVDLSRGTAVVAGTVAASLWRIACHEKLRTPAVSKEQLSKMKFKSLSSTVAGDGDIYYVPLQSSANTQNDKELLFIIKFMEDQKVGPLVPPYRADVGRVQLKCAEKKMGSYKNEYYDSSNRLAYLVVGDPAGSPTNWTDINLNVSSPLSTLHRIFCGDEFGGLGVEVKIDDKAVKVAKVIDGTPAARAGIKANDIITHLDNQSLSDLTLEQVVKKIRGPVNTKVNLQILRDGEGGAFGLVLTREIIQIKPASDQEKK